MCFNVLVEDDGAGFDPGRQNQTAPDGQASKSIGLENVRTRLQLFYNEQLHVDSAPGRGTRVSFSVRQLKQG